jgi:hypothetical protein
MFADELDALEGQLNRDMPLASARIEAWLECRDRSEPLEHVGHSGKAPAGCVDVCPLCGSGFASPRELAAHKRVEHRRTRKRRAAGEMEGVL